MVKKVQELQACNSLEAQDTLEPALNGCCSIEEREVIQSHTHEVKALRSHLFASWDNYSLYGNEHHHEWSGL